MVNGEFTTGEVGLWVIVVDEPDMMEVDTIDSGHSPNPLSICGLGSHMFVGCKVDQCRMFGKIITKTTSTKCWKTCVLRTKSGHRLAHCKQFANCLRSTCIRQTKSGRSCNTSAEEELVAVYSHQTCTNCFVRRIGG